MKKLSKRFLTLAIACVMAMAMAVPAFAATNSILSPVGRGNIRVNGYGIAGTARLTASSSVAQSKVVLQPASSMTNQKWTVEGSGNEGTIYTAQTPSGTRLAVNLWRVAVSSGVYPATLAATTGNTDDTYFHFSNYNSYRFRAWLNQGTYAGYRLYIDKSSTTSQYSDVYFVNSNKDPNTLWYWIVLCILTACTGRPSPSTYSNSSATSSDSNVEADNKNTEPTATGFKNLTRPYYSVLGCGGESGYYETRARDDGSANVTYIDYSSQKEIYLCNAPGCAHDNEGCTSWISAENAGVFPLISSDHLLLIHRTYGGEEGKQSLSRIDAASLDGSNRKTLITFNNGERLGDVFCTNGESLICSLTTLVQLPDTLESTFTLCMIDLNTGERVDLYVEDTTDGIQPEFLGVTETGYAVLHSSQQTKTESDFPGKEWSEISDEIARSTFHQWEKIPIGGNCCESFYEYTGNIQQLLMADGLYFYDVNTKKLIRISVQDSNIDEVADFISTDGNSAYIDGKFDEWLLMSIRHYEQHPNVEYPVAIESCYAINTQTKEVKELNIKQEIAEDRTIPIMLGQSATDLLLITDSQTNNVEHYGFEYSIISKEGYLKNLPAAKPTLAGQGKTKASQSRVNTPPCNNSATIRCYHAGKA